MKKLLLNLLVCVSAACGAERLKDLSLLGTANKLLNGGILTVESGATLRVETGATLNVTGATLVGFGAGTGDMIGAVNLAQGAGGVANATTALDNLAGVTSTSFGRGLLDETDAASLRTTLSLVPGTHLAQRVTTLAALKALSVAGLTTGSLAQTQNYSTANDGGGGLWYYDSASSATPNNGTIAQPDAGSGRWFRLFFGLVNVRWFGARGDGVANDTDAIGSALAAATSALYFPPGTYSCGARGDSGTQLFHVGNRSNLRFFGDGPASILKFASGMDRGVQMWGSGVGQTVANLHWHDLVIDMNGVNNLQTAFDNPTRFNSAIYLQSPTISDVVIERCAFRNISANQGIRVGNDTTSVPNRVTIRNCDFYGFGIGVPNNYSYDTSCLYLYGNEVSVTGNTFRNEPFPLDLAHGLTAVEYHSGRGLRVINNTFVEGQLCVLLQADFGDVTDAEISGNVMVNNAYAMILDVGGTDDFERVRFANNYYVSAENTGVGMLWIGSGADQARRRRNIEVTGNTFETSSTTPGIAGVIAVNSWWDDLLIDRNHFRHLTAQAVHIEGQVKYATATLVITNNTFESVGATTAGSPYFPSDGTPLAVGVLPNSGSMSLLVVEHNRVLNASGKNYNVHKGIRLSDELDATAIIVRHNSKAPHASDAAGGTVVLDAGATATFKDIRTLTDQPLPSLGTSTTVLHGNASGQPTFGVVTPADALGNTNGSGNFVLTTSPTLVTPNIGAATGTSATLTGAVSGSAITATSGNLTASGGRVNFNLSPSAWVNYSSAAFTFRDEDGDVISFPTSTSTVATVGGDIGAATASTASANDNDTSVATTAYVQTELTAYAADTVTFTNKTIAYGSNTLTGLPDVWVIVCSDETTALTTGTAKRTVRAPYAATVTAVSASLTTAQASGSIFTVDLNEGGTSILSSKLTVDNTEKTSTTAATPPVISDTAIAADAELTVDIDQIGTSGAAGLKVLLHVTRP